MASAPPPQLIELIFRTSLSVSTAIGVGSLAYLIYSTATVRRSKPARQTKETATELFISAPIEPLPCSDASSLAILLCKVRNVPSLSHVARDALSSPDHRLPYVLHQGKLYAGAGLSVFGQLVAPSNSSPKNESRALALSKIIALLNFLQEMEWTDPANVAALEALQKASHSWFHGLVTPFLKRALSARPAWSIVQSAYDEIVGHYRCLIAMLGDQSYFFADAATLIDAQIAAHVILLTSVPVTRSPLCRIFHSVPNSRKLIVFAEQFLPCTPVRTHALLSDYNQPPSNLVPDDMRLAYNRQRIFSTFFALSLHTYLIAAGIATYIYLLPPKNTHMVSTLLRDSAMLQLAGPATVAEVNAKAEADELKNSMKEMWDRYEDGK